MPVESQSKAALKRRLDEIPEHIRTDAQTLGRIAVGCEGTHGVFPRCNFTCTPCYHSSDANKVRIDGPHTVAEVEQQMAYLASVRGPHAHAQLIGGEASLLDPVDHAAALAVMRKYGREPMSFTHGDFDYEYLERLALGPDGKPRFKRLSFAAHFDTTMRGRRTIRRPQSEADLDPYRQKFCNMFRRLRKEHGVRSFLAHNVTVTPGNVNSIPEIIRSCKAFGFNLCSFQPAAFVGDKRRWKEDYNSLAADDIWAKIEQGAGTHLPFRLIQTGDERCNRSAFGYYIGNHWYSVFDEDEPADIVARDAFLTHFSGFHWGAPAPLLIVRLARVLASRPHLGIIAMSWLSRRVKRSGGLPTVLAAIARKQLVPMTFVMHRFMHADDVKPAWELLERGQMSDDPRVRETQERLQACFYAMAHPDTGRLIPACVQHSVLDPDEVRQLSVDLPLPRVQKRNATSAAVDTSNP